MSNAGQRRCAGRGRSGSESEADKTEPRRNALLLSLAGLGAPEERGAPAKAPAGAIYPLQPISPTLTIGAGNF
jgi:hypothetical protein